MKLKKSYFTSGEVARALNVSSATVNKWFTLGILTGYRLPSTGRDRRVSAESIIIFCDTHCIKVPGELIDESEPTSPEELKGDC